MFCPRKTEMITDVELSGEDDYFVQIAAHVLVLHLFDGFL